MAHAAPARHRRCRSWRAASPRCGSSAGACDSRLDTGDGRGFLACGSAAPSPYGKNGGFRVVGATRMRRPHVSATVGGASDVRSDQSTLTDIAWSRSPRCWVLSTAGGRRHVELCADLAREAEVDLTMACHDGAGASRAAPTRMVRALVDLPAVVSPQVALQITAFHAAIVRCSCSRSRWS